MSKSRPVYTVELAGLKRDLPLFEVKPGLKIAILNILGDTALVQASAKALGERLREYDLM